MRQQPQQHAAIAVSAGKHMFADILASVSNAAGVQRRLVQSTEKRAGDNAEVLGGSGEVYSLWNGALDHRHCSREVAETRADRSSTTAALSASPSLPTNNLTVGIAKQLLNRRWSFRVSLNTFLG